MVSQRIIDRTNNVLAPRRIFRCLSLSKKRVVAHEEEIDLGSSVKPKDIIICARGKKIYAMHKNDGRRLWRIKSPIGSSGGIISIFVTEDYKVLLGANGKAACIELMTGKQVWIQKMKRRWLCNEVSILSTPFASQPSKERHDSLQGLLSETGKRYDNYHSRTSSSSQLRTPSYTETVTSIQSGESECDGTKTNRVVCATSWGRCYGFDFATGDQLWCFPCPKGRLGFPTILFDGNGNVGELDWRIYVACNTMLYCLVARTGELLWSEKVSQSRWSFSSYITLATGWSSRLASEVYSGGFSQQPLVQIADIEEKVQVAAKLAIAIASGGAKAGLAIAG
ncbi:hypothetical protein BJV82DRAFT_604756 [Fennellomyces sp. T-0311]|nr:hypothetical protein BJV82DRAFT_604756 [Fennellomyces sp. T-0311]